MAKIYILASTDGAKREKFRVVDIIRSTSPPQTCYKYRTVLKNEYIYQTQNLKDLVIVNAI